MSNQDKKDHERSIKFHQHHSPPIQPNMPNLRHRFPGIWALGELNFYEFTHIDRSAVLLALDGGAASEVLEAEIRSAQAQLKEDFVFGAMNGTHW